MALIVCPECGKEISDTCEKCIHCGYLLKNPEQPFSQSTRYYKMTLGKIILLVACSIGITLLFMFSFVSCLITDTAPSDTVVQEDSIDSIINQTYSEAETTASPSAFDPNKITEQLDVTTYYFDQFGSKFAMVIKNNSAHNLDISVQIKFFDENGNLIVAENLSQEAFEKGTETILIFTPDEIFSDFKYEITAKKETYYNCVVSDLSYESVSAKKKEIVSVTNNSTLPADFVSCYALFFKDGKPVYYDYCYFTDDDNELKPGKTITKELDCYKEYDSVKFYFKGRR